MQNLQSVTKGVLKRVEEVTGKSIQFMRDDNLAVLSTLQMARHGAEFHVMRYRPSNDPIDYFVAFQAGFVLRLFECDPSNRFDFLPDSDAGRRVDVLLKAGQALGATDLEALPAFADRVAQWALMNLRSLPIGMRIDQWGKKVNESVCGIAMPTALWASSDGFVWLDRNVPIRTIKSFACA